MIKYDRKNRRGEGFIQLTIPGHDLLLRKSQGGFSKQLVILTVQRREKMAPGMLVSVQLTPILVQFQIPCLEDLVLPTVAWVFVYHLTKSGQFPQSD